MNKLFSKIATLSVGLAMAVGVGVALGNNAVRKVEATSISFSSGSAGGWKSTAGAQSGTKDGITLACSNGIDNGSQLRFYSGSTVTVSSTVGNITSVEFTCTGSGTDSNGPGKLSGSGYTYSGTKGTWSGNAASFTLSASAQVRCTNVAVTYVGRTLNSVVVSGTLTKTAYYVGEAFDPAGLTFTAKWSDGDVVLDATEIAKINWAALKAGDTSVKGTYEGVDFTVSGITVSEDTLNSITVTGTLTKSSYFVGDNWSAAGLVATGAYTGQGNVDITNQVEWSFDPATATSTSVTSVKFTASLSGKSGFLNCDVTVSEFTGYVRVSNVNDLHYGDEVLLGVHDDSLLMGAANSSKRNVVHTDNMMENYTKINDSDLEAGVVKFVVVYGTATNTIAFAEANGYLKASNGSNNLDTVTELSEGCNFVPVIKDGVMHVQHASYQIKYQDVNYAAEIKFNAASSGMFRMYAEPNTSMKDIDIYKKAGSADLESVRTFASTKMKTDQYVDDETYDESRCTANYSAAKTAYSALSIAAKNLFNNDSEFTSAKARLAAWATANGETFNANAGTFTKAETLINYGSQSQSTAVIIIIVSTMAITAAGVVLILKKKHR